MAQKKVKTRIQNKHDLEVNWITAGQNGFKPLKGEIIIYDKEYDESNNPLSKPNTRDYYYNYARFKIGDGETNINGLPFQAQSCSQPIIFGTESHAFTTYDTTESQVYLSMSSDNNYIEFYNFDRAPIGYTQTVYSLFDADYSRELDCYIYFYSASSNFDMANLKIFVKPAQCLKDSWTLANTVTEGTYNISTENNGEDYARAYFTLYLPSDRLSASSSAYKYTQGRTKLIIKKLDAETVLIEPDVFIG